MSDKEDKSMISLKHTQDIAQLELKISELENGEKILVSDIHKWKSRISELEKNQKILGNQNLDFMKEIEEIKEEEGKIWDSISDQFAELRNLIQGNAISDLNHYEVLRNKLDVWRNEANNELNELKEQFEEHLHGEYILREVLRELYNNLIGYYSLENKNLSLLLKTSLEKLDGAGSARQTEDNKCKEITGFNLKEVELLKEIYLKDSGGEKLSSGWEVATPDKTNSSRDVPVQNSKPPEPLLRCNSCKKNDECAEVGHIFRCTHYEPRENDFSEKLKLLYRDQIRNELISEFVKKLRKYLGCEKCTSTGKTVTCRTCCGLYPIIEEYEDKLK